ncbi:uncharacterized protein A1O5_08882 [Cladophialophora psammophila CBS 110553]|uniref:Uncharacterized protein n=1 Tax=Cladophialophora psammophila CBS 110553 TaxID=1182543 RepID=W9WJG2_9EURO|nr:uncharacterized protein A1O5_08882 [Cladophialophora psammophila CBS 110553]EXJ68267.1 hypothetical protein A1O5_08882 [Cladophialophora psammophila CBS 110553]
MFQDPDEVAGEQPAAKLDQIAAAARSSIRRESTVRPGRLAASRRAAIERAREQVEERLRREREADEVLNNYANTFPRSRSQRDPPENAQDSDTEAGRIRSIRMRSRLRTLGQVLARRANTESEPRSDMDVALLSRPRGESGARTRDDLASDFIFDTFMSESEEAGPQPLPRPLRESGLRFEVGVTSQSESESSRRPRFFNPRSTRVSSPSRSRRPPWSFSVHRPVFADAEDEENDSAYRSTSQPRGLGRGPGDTAISTPPPESLEAAYPPLRRVDHISPRPLGESRPRVDGLGDRLRSPSPMSDGPVEENWANLLNTMESGRSSTATSFLSSRSDSGIGSNQSSQATTATSFGEIGGDDSCDLDLPSGITEEDVREIRARHGRLQRDPPHHLRRPETRNELVSEANQSEPARGNERVLELEVLTIILDRMQRREEIPDEWWAAVGLSPDIVRGNAFDPARQYA